MIRDSVELNVPPAAIQYRHIQYDNVCVYVCVYSLLYIYLYECVCVYVCINVCVSTHTNTVVEGGIILLFYRVPRIEHAGGLDRGGSHWRVVGPAKRWACIFTEVKSLFGRR